MDDEQAVMRSDRKKMTFCKQKNSADSSNDRELARRCLGMIDPAALKYEEWVDVGMILKDVGCLVHEWSDWSRRDDGRYIRGECESKWPGFGRETGNKVTVGTLVKLAKDAGGDPLAGHDKRWAGMVPMAQAVGNDKKKKWVVIHEPLDVVPLVEPVDRQPCEELRQYLGVLFVADDRCNFVTAAQLSKPDAAGKTKWKPASKGTSEKVADLIEKIGKANDIREVVGDYNLDAGAWIRINPVDGSGGVRDANVTVFRNALVECDDMPVEEQLARIRALKLPCRAIVCSGGKSVHAIVHIDAQNQEEYRQRVGVLYDVCERNGLPVDRGNQNPARLSRMPGVLRGDQKQWLVDVNCGKATWTEWHEWVLSMNSGVPAGEHQVGEAVESSTVCATAAAMARPEDPCPTPMVQTLKEILWDLERQCLNKSERARQQRQAIVAHVKQHGWLYQLKEAKNWDDTYFFGKKTHRLWRLKDNRFEAWLATLTGIARNEQLFTSAHDDLIDAALNSGTPIEPKRYWHTDWQNGKWIATYLSNGTDELVMISEDGVKILPNGHNDVIFEEGNTLEPWKLVDEASATDPFETCKMFSEMKANDNGREILRLWSMSLPLDVLNKPPLVAYGAPASGKTSVIKGIFALFGLPERIVIAKKDESGAKDFWVSMDAGGLFCLDNCDNKISWLADSLSMASTGGSDERTKKYYDKEIIRLKARAALAITTVNAVFASDGAAADRSLVIRMQSRQKTETADTSLYEEIQEKRNACLSFITYTIRIAMSDEAEAPAGLNRRHPDWAGHAWKIGRAIDHQKAAEIAIRAAEEDKSFFALEQDQVGLCVLDVVRSGEPFKGTSSEFLVKMQTVLGADEVGVDWTAARVGKQLVKLGPVIQNIACYSNHGANGKTCHSINPHVGDVGDKGVFRQKSGHVYAEKNFCLNTPKTPTSPTNEHIHEIDKEDFENI